MTKKSAKLEESKELEELAERYKKKIGNVDTIDKFPEKYNPWREKNPEEENTQRKGKDIDELLDDFFEALKNDNKEFSWLKIDEDLYNELKDKNGRAASIDYGVPSHVRGDIENGTLFLCLVNPNIDVKVAMCEACQMKNKEDIKKYIFDASPEGGILYKEIIELKGMKELIGLENNRKDNEKTKIGYYTSNYFNAILENINDSEKEYEDLKKAVKSFKKFTRTLENDDENKPINYENINEKELENFVKISKKVVNLEAFPFRSSSPNFYIKDEDVDACEKRFANCLVKSTTDVSMLSARIIIWRILKYIDSNKKNKVRPVFIFRRFNRAWKPSIINVLSEDYGVNDNEIETILNEFHNKYFYTIGPKNQDNSLKLGKDLYQKDKNIYDQNNDEKKKEFKKLLKNALSLQKN